VATSLATYLVSYRWNSGVAKTSTGAKPTGGRPGKYEKSASFSLRADAAQLEELKAFATWRSWPAPLGATGFTTCGRRSGATSRRRA
jgi:hypothetical protein